jgi:hypothetical protein
MFEVMNASRELLDLELQDVDEQIERISEAAGEGSD